MNTTKYISDIISHDEIKTWKQNEIILISSGTGTGKTYFISHTLNDTAMKDGKKVLLLEPRLVLKKQQKEIACGGASVIDVRSYQDLEQNNFSLSNYDYIVLDEAHYLFNDSEFNDFTNQSYEKIANSSAVKVWISATCDDVKIFFKQKSIEYREYHVNNGKIVGTLHMIENDEDIENVIELVIHNDRKLLVVINDTEKLLRFYKKYKDHASIILGSGNTRAKSKKMKKEISNEIKYLATNETFSKNILFATCAVDCGTNIKDWNFEEIVIDGIYDINQILQIVGRKRKMSDGDTITLFVKNISNRTLNGYNTATKRSIRAAQYFLEHGQSEYIKWRRGEGNHFKDKYEILYDVETPEGYIAKAVNEMKLLYFQNRIMRVSEMIHAHKHGLKHALEKAFGLLATEWADNTKPVLEDIMKQHFENGTNWWTKEERNAFANELGFTDKYNRVILSYKALNGVLKHEYGSEYRIKCSRKRKVVDGKSKIFDAVWSIEKIYKN